MNQKTKDIMKMKMMIICRDVIEYTVILGSIDNDDFYQYSFVPCKNLSIGVF